MVADNPEDKIELKTFHGEIVNDHAALKKEIEAYQPLPKISAGIVERNYLRIKEDVQKIIQEVMESLLNDPTRMHLIVRKS